MAVLALLLGQPDHSFRLLKGYSDRFAKRAGEPVELFDFDGLASHLRKLDDRTGFSPGAPTADKGGQDTLLVFTTADIDGARFGLHQLHIRIGVIPIGTRGIHNDFLNEFETLLLRGRKAVRYLRNLIHPQYSTTPLLLPFRNFDSPEVTTTFEELQSEDLLHAEGGDPHHWLATRLSSLARLRKPNRPRNQNRSWIDRAGRSFQFANFDPHGANPPVGEDHLSCAVNGFFRFGVRINSAHHFDVTQGDGSSLRGRRFHPCHGNDLQECTGTRCNMWSNDCRIDKK